MWWFAWKGFLSLRFRTILTLLGIGVGTFALTTMGSMALHFHRMAVRFDNYLSGKIFIREQSGFFGAGALEEDQILSLKKNPKIAEVIPILVARLRSRELIVFGFPQMVLGLPSEEIPVLFRDVTLLKGSWPANSSQCVLGIDLALSQGREIPTTFTYQSKSFKVSGVMARTNGPEDRQMLVSLPTLEALLGRAGLVSYGIAIPAQRKDLDGLVRSIASKHPHWDVLPPTLLSNEAHKSELLWDALTLGTALLAALVGGLGILTIMTMSVQERMPEIAVARALGAGRSQVFFWFIVESLIFSGCGTLLGIFSGVFFIHQANAFLSRQGMVLFESTLWIFAVSFGATALLTLTGGLYPAYYASAIKPSEVLRR